MSQTDSAYRPDIDGLRAVAVTAVLLFHAFPNLLRGGFTGVDVFFVISGFLITSILIGELREGRFSILRFYVRRARRLFPALLIVLVTTALACWVLLLGIEWRNFGKHLTAGATYLSNVLLWREVGYFDPQAESKPLLHLWSLAVEEQFYLVWPLLLWAVYVLLKWRPALLTAVLALASLALGVWLTRTSQPAAFYLPVTRFWELAAGGMLAMAVRGAGNRPLLSPPWAQLAGAGGVLLIALGIWWQYPPGTFPGVIVALPVLGTVLVIAAGPAGFFNRYVLGAAPVVYIGRISYPLYLWHWPLLSLAFLLADGDIAPNVLVGLLAATVLLAALTERYVERPFRMRVPAPQGLVQARNLWLATAAAGVAGIAILMGWIPARSASSAAALQVETALRDWTAPESARIERDPASVVLLAGDSHMQQYWPRAAQVARAGDASLPSVELLTSSGCPPLPGLDRIGHHCTQFFDELARRAAAPDVRRVVIAASWAGLAERTDLYVADDPERTPIAFLGEAGRAPLARWTEALKALKNAGKDVVVILSTPRGPDVRPERLYDRWRGRATGAAVVLPREQLYARVAPANDAIRAAALAAGVRVIEPFDWICEAASCRVADPAGDPVYIDESHLRAGYVRRYASFLDELLH